MGPTQPPVQYLFASSMNAVEAHCLSCQNNLANVERSLTDLLDRWLQVQNAERFSRTVLQLRRVDADPQFLGLAARGRLLPPGHVLPVCPPSALVHSLPPIATSAPLQLQGSAFAIAEETCLRSAAGFDVTTGIAKNEFTPPSYSRPLSNPTLPLACSIPLLESRPSASGTAFIDDPLRIRGNLRSAPLPSRPTISLQPRPAHMRFGRAQFGRFRSGPLKQLLRAGDFAGCAKIA